MHPHTHHCTSVVSTHTSYGDGGLRYSTVVVSVVRTIVLGGRDGGDKVL